MILIENGDKLRAYDSDGNFINAVAIRVTPEWVRVRFDLPFPYEHSQRVYARRTMTNGNCRYWHLEVVRECAWCEHDISGAAQAHPVMYSREGGPNQNWQCADQYGCLARQMTLMQEINKLLTEVGFWPTTATRFFLGEPRGELEAALCLS